MLNLILAALLLFPLIQSQTPQISQSLSIYWRQHCTTTIFHAFDSVNGAISIDTSPLTPPMNPRFATVNSTAWEQWYFDSISSNGESNSVITFFRDPSLDVLGLGSLWVMHDAVWSNGTRASTIEFVEEAMVVVCPGYTFGLWNSSSQSSEFTFNVTSDSTQASISVSTLKTQGTLNVTTLGPARYPDGLLYPDKHGSLFFAPMLWWVEAVPAGNTQVDFEIGGSEIGFTGYGGVDYFAGSYIWDYICKDWYWMRGVVGPYSIVFWQFTSAIDNNTYTSAFLVQNGAVIFSTQNSGLDISGPQDSYANITLLYGTGHGVVTAPMGLNDTGYALDFVEGITNGVAGRRWHFETQHQNVGFSTLPGINSVYTRFADSAKGGQNEQKVYKGAMNTEQFVTKVVYPLI
ncbi:uncharacterized protein PAC_19568 [Phialocephala subalpina]|uniref:Uncharacterized protein n=1 Tax=Phialocephala subalpina TaxID=576137 RepID=A0A1L7XXD1_9HELO|nr:uncharacterized protein PAC_19568 [Phialocephala subalpina]